MPILFAALPTVGVTLLVPIEVFACSSFCKTSARNKLILDSVSDCAKVRSVFI